MMRGHGTYTYYIYKADMEKKRFYRSYDRMLGGVCGGIAEYFDIDPTLVRLAYVVLTFGTAFSGIIVYLLLWLIMPERH